MPKKSMAARGGTQRNRPKAQKSFEVVRQTSSDEQIMTDERTEEVSLASYSTTPTPATEPARATPRKAVTSVATVATPEVSEVQEEQESPVTTTASTPQGSAAARLATRRQGQRSQLKSPVNLITAEHYSYVRRDLIFIAVLASCMFIAIIVLYFVLGKGF